ncbi:MAG: hypothetical protein AB7I42_26020 [Bradyrhizobium sp.]|uniref:hypothetical protein n=1 Tax=Bradyrhizobium sp. TaxID=376 RepID=UPI003D13214B
MKIQGHCSVSGDPCFEILETFNEPHPLAGQPRRIGKPLPDAVRVTLVLVDGTTADFTCKQRYVPEFYAHLPLIWREVQDRVRFDRKNHKAYKQPDFSEEQHAQMDAWNLAHIDNVPLGVLAWRKWSDINGD